MPPKKPDQKISSSSRRSISSGNVRKSSKTPKKTMTEQQRRGKTLQNLRSITNSKDQTLQRKFRPSEKALSQIRKYNKVKNLLIRKLPFQRLVREITRSQLDSDQKEFRWTSKALEVLQSVSEDYLVNLMEDANLCTLHAK